MPAAKRGLVAGSLLVLLLVVVLWGERHTRVGPATPAPVDPAEAPPGGREEAPDAASRDPVPAPSGARAGAPPAAPAPPEAEEGIAIEGRCLGSGGIPLPGVAIRVVELGPGAQAPFPEHPARSDLEGRFRVGFVPGPTAQLLLQASMEGCATREAWLGRPGPGATVDLGDFLLPPGCTLAGDVADEQGQPLADVLVVLTSEAAEEDALGPIHVGVANARTEADGSFRLAQPIRADCSWRVAIRGGGVSEWDPTEWVGVPGGRHRLQVRCTRTPPIEGVVLAPAGAVAGVQVRAFGAESGRSSSLSAGTDGSGRFVLEPVAGAEPAVVLRLDPATAKGFDAPGVVARWGDEGVVLQATLAPHVVLDARSAESGAPVTELAVSIARSPGEFVLGELRTSPDGRHIVGVEAGERHLYVVPARGLSPIGPIVVHGERDSGKTVSVLFPPSRSLAVSVPDVRRGPGTEVRIRLIGTPGGRDFSNDDPLVPGRSPTLFPKAASAVVWDEALAGADGEARVVVPSALEGWRYFLLASSPDLGDTVVEVPEGAQRVSIELGQRAAVEGSMVGEWPAGSLVFLEREGGDAVRRVPGRAGALPQGRTWRIDGVPPGSWTVSVLVHGIPVPARTVQVGANGVCRVELAASDCLAPSRRVAVLVAGAPLEHGTLRVSHVEGAGPRRVLSLEVRAGECVLPPLPLLSQAPPLSSGTYEASLEGRQGSAPLRPAGQAVIEF